MKYRIRFYLCLISLPIVATLSFNQGHTVGLKDMAKEYASLECWSAPDMTNAAGGLGLQLPKKASK